MQWGGLGAYCFLLHQRTYSIIDLHLDFKDEIVQDQCRYFKYVTIQLQNVCLHVFSFQLYWILYILKALR